MSLIGSLDGLRNWCRANGISAALNQDSQRNGKDLLDELFAIGNCAPVYSGNILKVIPYDEVSAADNGAIFVSPTSSGPIADLTDKDFVSDGKTSPVKYTRQRRTNCDNVVSVEFVDRTIDYAHNVATGVDQKAVALYGPRKGGTLDASDLGQNIPSGSKQFLSLSNPDAAKAIANILAKRNAAGVNHYVFTLKAEWMGLEAMDLVTITDSRLGLNQMPVRLTSVKENANRELACEADQFIYGLNHPDTRIQADASGSNSTAQGSSGSGAGVDPGLVNAPIIFQPTPQMLGTNAVPQLWFVVSGADPNYGGCVAYLSIDGGATYSPVGSIGPGTTGFLTADFPNTADPDTTDTLAVDLTESSGAMSTVSQAIADAYGNQCYIYGTTDYDWEIVCPTIATLTSAEHYSMATYIRRGVLGSTLADHPLTGSPLVGKRFASLSGVFGIDIPTTWIGLTLRFKFAAYNKVGAQQNDLANCAVYTYTPIAITVPGGFYINGGGGSSSPQTVSLTWTPSSDPTVISYNVYRGNVSGGPYSRIGQGITTAGFDDRTAFSGHTYYYTVTAVSASGESDYAGEFVISVP